MVMMMEGDDDGVDGDDDGDDTFNNWTVDLIDWTS